MKKIVIHFLLICLPMVYFSQAPANYYNGTAGLTGATLKTKLHQIIKAGHSDQGYDGLYTGYLTTDRDYFFENDGTVLDMYSENPTGTDPYNFTPNVATCGNYSNEGDCYNREHIVPQSLFSEASPMKNDIHSVRPTDGKVNGMRSNYPYGKVGTASWTSLNGSKLGSSISSGYSGTVFEPIDRFKGDIARMIFYFVTRYEDRMTTFSTGNMLATNTYPSLQNWQLQQLLLWNTQDPVSAEEVARNNASYTFQGNRNPYIDNQQWVNDVWGTPDTTNPTPPTNLATSNPTVNAITLTWTAATDNVGIASYDIYINGVYHSTVTGTTATISGLSASTTYNFTVKAKDLSGNVSDSSNTATGTTATPTNLPSGTELYISEYVEGSSNNKAIEITNPTASAIDLSNYSIQKQSNGAGSWINNLVLTGTLQPGATHVITNTSAAFSCTFTSNQNAAAPIDFNGNDPVGLFKNGNLIDIVGTFNGGSANFAADVTLRRNILGPSTTYVASHWDVLAQNTCDNLGVANPTTIMSTIENITPNNFVLYPNPVTQGIININGNITSVREASIFSIDGRLIQRINQPFKKSNSLDVQYLRDGIYFLILNNTSIQFLVKKN